MNRKIIFILAFAIVRFDLISAYAQSDSCIVYLKTANSNYEQRDFDGSIKLLQKALNNCNLDRADKIQSHKLLALSYLAIDNLEAADKEAEAMIKIDPNYTPDKFKDDPKLSALFEKYKPVPVFKIGFSAGINMTKIGVDKTYSIVHDNDAADLGTYSGKTGFQLGLNASYRAYRNFWVQLEGQYRQSGYKHILNDIENTTINYSEKISYFELPLSIKYFVIDETDRKISPFVETGTTFSFLSDALSTTTREDDKDLVNRTDYRNTYMTGFHFGAGAAYSLRSISVFAAFRYNIFSDVVNKDGTRFDDVLNVWKYFYIDDDFKINNWQINMGVNYSISYKNRKIK